MDKGKATSLSDASGLSLSQSEQASRTKSLAYIKLSSKSTSIKPALRSFTLRPDMKKMVIGRSSSRTDSTGRQGAADNAYFDGQFISREHAEIYLVPEEQVVYIRDTNSMHGTFVNNTRVSKASPTILLDGDELSLGGGSGTQNTNQHTRTFKVNIRFSPVVSHDDPKLKENATQCSQVVPQDTSGEREESVIEVPPSEILSKGKDIALFKTSKTFRVPESDSEYSELSLQDDPSSLNKTTTPDLYVVKAVSTGQRSSSIHNQSSSPSIAKKDVYQTSSGETFQPDTSADSSHDDMPKELSPFSSLFDDFEADQEVIILSESSSESDEDLLYDQLDSKGQGSIDSESLSSDSLAFPKIQNIMNPGQKVSQLLQKPIESPRSLSRRLNVNSIPQDSVVSAMIPSSPEKVSMHQDYNAAEVNERPTYLEQPIVGEKATSAPADGKDQNNCLESSQPAKPTAPAKSHIPAGPASLSQILNDGDITSSAKSSKGEDVHLQGNNQRSTTNIRPWANSNLFTPSFAKPVDHESAQPAPPFNQPTSVHPGKYRVPWNILNMTKMKEIQKNGENVEKDLADQTAPQSLVRDPSPGAGPSNQTAQEDMHEYLIQDTSFRSLESQNASGSQEEVQSLLNYFRQEANRHLHSLKGSSSVVDRNVGQHNSADNEGAGLVVSRKAILDQLLTEGLNSTPEKPAEPAAKVPRDTRLPISQLLREDCAKPSRPRSSITPTIASIINGALPASNAKASSRLSVNALMNPSGPESLPASFNSDDSDSASEVPDALDLLPEESSSSEEVANSPAIQSDSRREEKLPAKRKSCADEQNEAEDVIQVPPSKRARLDRSSSARATKPNRASSRAATTAKFLLAAVVGGVAAIGTLASLPESLFV